MAVMPPQPGTLSSDKVAVAVFDASASAALQKETVGCRLRLQKIGLNRGFDAATKSRIASELGITKARAVSGHHKIYDDTHPEIKKHNDLFNRIESYWKGCTLPLAAAYNDNDGVMTEGGTRLLRRDKSEEFHAQLTAFRSEAATVAASLNSNRASILAAAAEMLGARFDPGVYPEKFAIDVFWSFPNVEVPSYLATMAPQAYEHERQLVAKRFEDTYQLATTAMLEELHAVMASWANALGPVIMLRPDGARTEFDGWYGAEVLRTETHADNPEAVPAGQRRLRLRTVDGTERWTPALTDDDYAALHAYKSTDKKRIFRDSTVENLVELMKKFSTLGGLIHKTGQLDLQLKEMDALLQRFSGTAELSKELRTSTVFRENVHKWAANISDSLGSQIATFTASRCAITKKPIAAK
jgi:hypothetical protein